MNKTKRVLSFLLAVIMVLSLCPVLTTAAPANGFTADSQWEEALLGDWFSYYAPYYASSNSETYFSSIGTGHLQGMCVDEDASYMYVSYTNGIGKIDMATGEVAGILTGFDGGLHIGCMAYYDGYIYASFEAQATHKFYIIQVDESKFHGIMDTKEEWANAVRVVLLYEPTVDARDLMGDTDITADNLAGRSEVTGHRFSNAGIDGITFGTYPGEFGKKDADTYMFVVYGTYWFGTNSATAGVTAQNYRYDDEHTIIQAYNTSDFLNEENQSQYLLELAYTDTTTPDSDGVANARSIYYDNDSVLHAEKTLYVFTGNTQWGCQNFEYDKSTGDIWLATYGASNGSPEAGMKWFVIDGNKAPQTVEIQLGQNVNLNTDQDTTNDVTLYGSVASRSQGDRVTITEQAVARAERYTNKASNPTNNTTGTYYWWEGETVNGQWVQETDDYHWYDDRPELKFNEDGYLVGDVPYLKCLCGECSGLEGKGDYQGYTKENGYDTDNMILCGNSMYMAYGLVSLGNDYWYINGSDTLILYHYNWDTHTFTQLNASNVESFMEQDNLGEHNAADLTAALTERLTKVKEGYPTQVSYCGENWSDSCWSALQAAVAQAETALESGGVEELEAALAALKQAKKNMRVGVDEFLTMTGKYIEEDLYTEDSWEAYEATMANLSGDYPSQVFLDDKLDDVTAAYGALEMKNTLVAGNTALTGTPVEENGSYVTIYDVAGKGYHMLNLTVASGTDVTVTVDGITASGTEIPINGAKEIVITSSTENGVSGNFITYSNPGATLKGISVNGMELEGFKVGTREYSYRIPAGGAIPVVTAEADLGCSAEVTQAVTVPGVAYITVTKSDSTLIQYKVYIIEDETINTYEYAEMYASDVPESMIKSVTTYPNRRGLDGEDERFMRDQGWVDIGATDAALKGIAANGSTVTYTKGFTLHGIVSYKLENGEAEVGLTDQQIRDMYTDADGNLSHEYSSVVFDVDGKGYTTFSATMSAASKYKCDPGANGTSCTVRFYVDGVLVKEYPMNGSSAYWGIEVSIDIPKNAKTLTVQLDPKNVNGIGKDNDWAWRDIIVFGNAKFTNYVENMPEKVFISDLPVSAILDKNVNYYGVDAGYSGAAMEIPNTDGSKLTFGKGITIEGTAHKGSDAAYKQPFIDSNTLSEYSRIEYDLEGLGVTTFKGIMGLTYSRRAHAQTSMTVRFYVDDVKVEEYILHPQNASTNNDLSGRATEIEIDLTGAKTFSIQVDPENRTEELGYTGQGVDSVNDWAWGDIITIGNARFIQQVAALDEHEDCADHHCDVGYKVEPTCTSYGYTRWTCPNCGDYTVSNITDKLAHTFTNLVAEEQYLAEAATCTEQAKYYLLCSVCNEKGHETATDTNGALAAHEYHQEVVHDKYLKSKATHASSAVYYKSCSCGAFITGENAQTFTYGSCIEHVYYMEVADAKYLKSEATCQSAAVYYKSCSCGAFVTGENAQTFTYGQKAEHVYDQKVVDEKYLAEEANCTFHAKYYMSCACGHAGNKTFLDESSPLGGHIPVVDKAVEPTYTATGLTEGSHCEVCQKVLAEQQTVPMLTAPGTSNEKDPEGTKPEDTDTDTSPATGESYRLIPAAALMLLGAAAAAILVIIGKRRLSV